MSGGFELVTLECPGCGAPLAAEGEDVIYYCTACYRGHRLAGEGEAPGAGPLLPVEVSFVAAPAVGRHLYRPFWLLPARVEILTRRAAGGVFSGLMSFFLGDRQETGSPPGEGTFAVPAFRAPLAPTVELALAYTRELPKLGEILGERLTGGTTGVDDARKLAHYTLIASEARKPDMLEELDYLLEFGPPRLLGVPFVRRGEALADALFGLAG